MKQFLLFFLFSILIVLESYAQESPKENPIERIKWMQSTYENSEVEAPLNFKILQKEFSANLPNANENIFYKGSQISSQTWLHAGPNNVGGRTRTIAYDRTNPNIIITGGVSGGIWRSIDGGQSWVQTTGINDIVSVTTIIQDPRPEKNNNWYCAGGEYDGNSASKNFSAWHTGNGIYKSTDNGITWNNYGTTGDNQPHKRKFIDQVLKLAINPNDTDEVKIYAACIGGVFTISDNGNKIENTIDLEGYKSYNYSSDIIITPSGKFYITLSYKSLYIDAKTTHSGIFYSENGSNWENISPDFLQPSRKIVMDYSSTNEDLLYFFGDNVRSLATGCSPTNPNCCSIFKLERSQTKNTWTDLSDNIPYFNVKNNNNVLNPQTSYNMAIKISPQNPNTILLGATNCYVSYDGFASTDSTYWIGGYNPEYDSTVWIDPNKSIQEKYAEELNMMHPKSGWDFHCFKFNPNNPNEVISTSDHGVHKTDDISKGNEIKWIDLNQGYCTTQYYDCSINHHDVGDFRILGGLQDNGTLISIDAAGNYARYYYGDGYKSYFTKNEGIICSSYNNFILRLKLQNGIPVDGNLIKPADSIPIDHTYSTVYAVNTATEKELALGANNAICINNNPFSYTAGFEWDIHYIDNVNATCATYGNSPDKKLYVGTRNKRIFKVTDFSKDKFKYDIIDLPSFVTGKYVSQIWVDPNNSNHIIVIVSNHLSLGMLESLDGGQNWIDHGGNLEEKQDGSGAGPSMRCYNRIVYQGDTLHFLGTSDGLFSTKKLHGQNTIWLREGNTTIGKAVIEDIEVRQADGYIVVATHGNGIFKTNYTTSISDFNGNNLGFVATEVYPNPASQMISFVINSDDLSQMEAKIVDLNGNPVAKVFSEKIIGSKTISYDISNLSSGTYFLHISKDRNYVTKKITIAK